MVYDHSARPLVDDGVLWIGDAAGLAYAESGEGIRPGVESGIMAARVIAAAAGDYARGRFGGLPAADRSPLWPAAYALAGRTARFALAAVAGASAVGPAMVRAAGAAGPVVLTCRASGAEE